VVALIRSFKPYKGGNEALYGLHDLDLTDKHRALVPILNMVGMPDLAFHSESGDLLGGFFNCSFGPIEDGKILLTCPLPTNLQVGNEIGPAIEVAFDHSGPFRGEPVLKTLQQLIQLVDGIVKTFETHFK
jgi:hypothetical protein